MDQTLYLITNEGLQFLVGKDGDAVREKLATVSNPQDFQFYDDDRHTWATWAKMEPDGSLKPHTFPPPEKYGITSAELYAKTVTYSRVLAQVIRLINYKAPTLWEKLMKPTTVIGAIVLIVLIMIIGVVALQG